MWVGQVIFLKSEGGSGNFFLKMRMGGNILIFYCGWWVRHKKFKMVGGGPIKKNKMVGGGSAAKFKMVGGPPRRKKVTSPPPHTHPE